MGKTFRDWDIEQLMMFPPSVDDCVPEGHLAHFVRSTVSKALDLAGIVDCYNEERGYPPYHPVMMTALVLYAYCQGIYPSRRIAKACRERVDFMAITGMQTPDFRAIRDFRKRHRAALEELFVQVVRLCQEAGLVKLGHVALDGTKLKANASKHKAMSYGRMKKAEPELEAIVRGWLRQAEAADLRDDQEHGVDLNGEELPDWVRDKQRRLEKIREARARLQAEAQAAEKGEEKKSGGPGRPRKNEPGTPKDSAQTNFTDPQSRIMKSHDGFIQGYNAQAVVDGIHHGLSVVTLNKSVVAFHDPALRVREVGLSRILGCPWLVLSRPTRTAGFLLFSLLGCLRLGFQSSACFSDLSQPTLLISHPIGQLLSAPLCSMLLIVAKIGSLGLVQPATDDRLQFRFGLLHP